MEEQPRMVRMYSLDQEKIDEAMQVQMDFILVVASDKKLSEIKEQLEAKLSGHQSAQTSS